MLIHHVLISPIQTEINEMIELKISMTNVLNHSTYNLFLYFFTILLIKNIYSLIYMILFSTNFSLDRTIDVIYAKIFIYMQKYFLISSTYRQHIVQISSTYHPHFIQISPIYHPHIIHKSSTFHPEIVQISSTYHPDIIHISSIYRSRWYHPHII